jgi:inward rectifier potassium channel
MSSLGSTRVFAHSGSEVVVVGLRRRPARDLYHWLVTGPWSRLLVLYALVYFATSGLFAMGRVLLAAHDGGSLLPAISAVVDPAGDPRPALSARAIAMGALDALDGFVHWVELVIGSGIVLAKFALVRARVLFSDVAVVGPHADGQALMFRMANERTSHIVDAEVSVMSCGTRSSRRRWSGARTTSASSARGRRCSRTSGPPSTPSTARARSTARAPAPWTEARRR